MSIDRIQNLASSPTSLTGGAAKVEESKATEAITLSLVASTEPTKSEREASLEGRELTVRCLPSAREAALTSTGKETSTSLELPTRTKKVTACAADAALELGPCEEVFGGAGTRPPRERLASDHHERGIPGAGVFFSETDAEFLRSLKEVHDTEISEIKDTVPLIKKEQAIVKVKARKITKAAEVGLEPKTLRNILSFIPAKGVQISRMLNTTLDTARKNQFFEYILEPKKYTFIERFLDDEFIFLRRVILNHIDINYHALIDAYIKKKPDTAIHTLERLLFMAASRNYMDLVKAIIYRPEINNPYLIGRLINKLVESNHEESIQELIDENVINPENIDEVLEHCLISSIAPVYSMISKVIPDPDHVRLNRLLLKCIRPNRSDLFAKILDGQKGYQLPAEIIAHLPINKEFLLCCLVPEKRVNDDLIKQLLPLILDAPSHAYKKAVENLKILLGAVELTTEERDQLLLLTPDQFSEAIKALIDSGPTTEAIRVESLTRSALAERTRYCFRLFGR